VLLFTATQHGTATPYLPAALTRVADIDPRRRLRTSNTAALAIPRSKHSMIPNRSFTVAAARVSNSMPPFVLSSPSQPGFKQRLKKSELYISSMSLFYNIIIIIIIIIISYSLPVATFYDFHTQTSESIPISLSVLSDPQILSIAIGILLLSCVSAEI